VYIAVTDWADREIVKADLNKCGRAVQVCWFIAPAFAIVRIIGDVANVTPGLEPTSWFLWAITVLLAGIIFRIGGAVSWYLNTNK
jgi:Ca2+/H+ antiporter